mmetsp:Transcript_30621/g.59844  ORF Transcript_30621/g.59844 Transcript_30621/m.59844 type:complete len:257 (+) Transcript_30621:382-1152(+)
MFWSDRPAASTTSIWTPEYLGMVATVPEAAPPFEASPLIMTPEKRGGTAGLDSTSKFWRDQPRGPTCRSMCECSAMTPSAGTLMPMLQGTVTMTSWSCTSVAPCTVVSIRCVAAPSRVKDALSKRSAGLELMSALAMPPSSCPVKPGREMVTTPLLARSRATSSFAVKVMVSCVTLPGPAVGSKVSDAKDGLTMVKGTTLAFAMRLSTLGVVELAGDVVVFMCRMAAIAVAPCVEIWMMGTGWVLMGLWMPSIVKT